MSFPLTSVSEQLMYGGPELGQGQHQVAIWDG